MDILSRVWAMFGDGVIDALCQDCSVVLFGLSVWDFVAAIARYP